LFRHLFRLRGRLSVKPLVVLATVVAALAYTGSVAAAAPTHIKVTTTDTELASAGEVCDFEYSASFTAEENMIVFGDPNDPTKVIDHISLVKTHTNVETGYSLTDVDHFTVEFNTGTERLKQVGVAWHLRDARGKLVVVQAGQLVFDTSTGEIVKGTPSLNPDFAAVICPALGGNPAD
jgi:hypothetical protein